MDDENLNEFNDKKDVESIYEKEDFIAAKNQKKKYKIIYFTILGAFILFAAAMLVLYLFEPYKSHDITWIKVGTYTGTGIFVIFSFIYLGIPFRRVKNYYKFLHGVETGIDNETAGIFDRYSEELEIRDGIEYKSIIFLEYNTKKQDFFERKVLFDTEKQFPEFSEGENVKYYTHGNVLVGYERL